MRRERALVLGKCEVALAVARSLHSKGIEADLAFSDERFGPALHSRCTSRLFEVPPPRHDRFVEAVASILGERGYDLLIPANRRYVRSASLAMQTFSDEVEVAAPEPSTHALMYDKKQTADLAQQCDIPVPHTGPASPDTLDVIVEEKSCNRAVLKSRTGSGGEGVSILTAGQAREILAASPDDNRILQEYVPGATVCLNVLCDGGDIIAVTQEKRIHQVPAGPGAYRKTMPLDRELLGYVASLMAAADWTGVAHVEFRVNEERAVLVEVNGRLWGSVALSVHAGVDFPRLCYDLFAHGRTPDIPPTYVTGCYGRNLVRSSEWAISGGQPRRLGLANILRRREHIDEFAWQDPLPGIATAAYILRRGNEIISGHAKEDEGIGNG